MLFNGRLFNELKSVSYATKLGKSDAHAAVAAARREGFPARTIIFLDQEQGGRMLPEQKAYIYAWVDGVTAGSFLAGIYCSGISAAKEGGEDIVTADDIRQNAGARKIVFWVTNDACPPSPGCAFPNQAPSPADAGISFAEVWQFAQSPKTTRGCGKLSGELQPRWKLLSAWDRHRRALAYRRKHGNQCGSIPRSKPVNRIVEALLATSRTRETAEVASYVSASRLRHQVALCPSHSAQYVRIFSYLRWLLSSPE